MTIKGGKRQFIVGSISASDKPRFGIELYGEASPDDMGETYWEERIADWEAANGLRLGEGLLTEEGMFIELLHACGEPWYVQG